MIEVKKRRTIIILFGCLLIFLVVFQIINLNKNQLFRFETPEAAFYHSTSKYKILNSKIKDNYAIVCVGGYCYVLKDDQGWIPPTINYKPALDISKEILLPYEGVLWVREFTDGINLILVYTTIAHANNPKLELEIKDNRETEFDYFETDYGDEVSPLQCWFAEIDSFEGYILTVNGHNIPLNR